MAYVPKQIEDLFRKIRGVKEIKLLNSDEKELEVIVVLEKKYNHETYEKIVVTEADVRESLKSRGQKFYASISW